jgi:hypothetical protein
VIIYAKILAPFWRLAAPLVGETPEPWPPGSLKKAMEASGRTADEMIALDDEAPISVEVYEELWRSKARVFLPDTIVYKYGRLDSWFFASESKDGGPPVIKKKSRSTMTNSGVLDMVIERLCYRAEGARAVVAVWVGGHDPGENCQVLHLSAQTLERFLKSTPDKGHGILQKFVPPMQAGAVLQNSMVRASWSPHVCSLELRRNLHGLYDPKVALAHRTATFDGTSRDMATQSTGGAAG